MKKARIENGVVREILIADPFPDFAPELVWVECEENVQERWLYDGVSFAPPAPDVRSAPTPLEQIAAIEAANPITHRNLRDLSITVAQIAAAVTGTDPMVNPAVQQIVALEAQIAVLRAQIT